MVSFVVAGVGGKLGSVFMFAHDRGCLCGNAIGDRAGEVKNSADTQQYLSSTAIYLIRIYYISRIPIQTCAR